ncbi:Hypothetical protein NTJ_06879 [Nesidiocoris tenuis]|uniref:TOG domain-containing protein n=1 Tax=Nesidiocoris tenuis TaxID=355587 RepID=A0ABN7ARI1_9HEMI|nr:Hypothetical protein NTJ_06879 [Nesidiocoris tenuis]
MEVKSRPPAQQIENAKIDRRTPSTPLRHQRPSTAGGGGQLLELTPIWQKVVNGRWPSDVDRADVFNELAVRLAEPEWEVRQHGLRVLADIIPALADSNGTADLDALMAPSVLGAVTHNLAHPAPAVRASALAVLLAYLKFTADPEFVLRSIVTTGLESPAASGNLASAVVQILPKLIDQTISISHQSLVHLVTAVSKKLTHMQHQRQAIETLQRIKEHVGDSRFNHFLESYYPQIKRDLDVLHQVYRVEPNLRDSGIDLQTGQDTWSESSLSPTQPKFDDVVKIEEYDGAESDQESDDDCKIANDNDDVNRIMASNSALLAARSEADRLLLPDDDDDDDGGDSPRKSPRRVRFGGEDVKLRTPDSDVTGDNPHPPTGSAETLSFDDGKPQNGDDDDPSFEVIAGEAATTSPRQPAPQQQTRRAARSSHIPVPINPALSRPRRRSGDRSVASYETGDSSVTSSSEGETFRGRDFLAFMGQGPVPRAAGAGPGAPVPDLSFLPSELIHLLAKQDDWRTRVRGLDRLASWVSSGRLTGDQGKHLLWYMIGCLSEEPRQGRLIASVLRATRAIIAASPNNLDAILAWLVPSICRHLACGSPLPARLEAVDAIKTLMRISTPSSVISVIFSDRCVHSRSSKLRENSLLCLLYALMTFPSNEFDCVSLTSRIKEMAVSEPKRRVRQAILETLAVLSQFVPRTAMSVDTDDDDNSDDAQFFSDGLQARLARRQLPAVSHEGLILYALQIPPMTGTDVDWILAGVGSLSSGSARSRAQVDNSPKSHLSQSSDNMFHSTWSKEPSSQKMMAVGVAVPQRSYDNLYSVNNNYDERIYYSPSWSTDPRHSHPSNTQGFPHLNTSYGGRYSTRNSNNANANKNDRTADLSQTWNGSRWTAQAEIPPHVSIKSSVLSQTQNYHSGLPPIGGAHVADWRNRKDNTEQLLTSGYRVYNQDDYKKGRWDFRQDNVSFRRPAM